MSSPDALQYYNKAISSLVKTISEGSRPSWITLVLCLLFTCVEFLRKDIPAANLHIRSGLKLLEGEYATAGFDFLTTNRYPLITPVPFTVQDSLVPIYTRLRLLLVIFSSDSRPARRSMLTWRTMTFCSRYQSFETVDAARSAMVSLLVETLRFRNSVMESDYSDVFEDRRIKEQRLLETKSELWSTAFERFLETRQDLPLDDRRGIIVLQIQKSIVRYWLRTNLIPHDLSPEDCLDDFESIVHLAESFVRLAQGSDIGAQPLRFSFEMGIIAPLFFTAFKCRDPTLRRRAIALLYCGPRQEGSWDAISCAKAAERLVEMEERGVDLSSIAPPATPKIWCARINFSGDGFEHNLTLRSKPSSLGGTGEEWHERVPTCHDFTDDMVGTRGAGTQILLAG